METMALAFILTYVWLETISLLICKKSYSVGVIQDLWKILMTMRADLFGKSAAHVGVTAKLCGLGLLLLIIWALFSLGGSIYDEIFKTKVESIPKLVVSFFLLYPGSVIYTIANAKVEQFLERIGISKLIETLGELIVLQRKMEK